MLVWSFRKLLNEQDNIVRRRMQGFFQGFFKGFFKGFFMALGHGFCGCLQFLRCEDWESLSSLDGAFDHA